MIEPTVGRIVWFYTSGTRSEAQAAIVTKVWNSRMVNLCVFDFGGGSGGVSSVDLLQDDAKPEGRSSWCEWMPYQKGQAAKTEALEAKLAS
jgi:hypothetical protein